MASALLLASDEALSMRSGRRVPREQQKSNNKFNMYSNKLDKLAVQVMAMDWAVLKSTLILKTPQA